MEHRRADQRNRVLAGQRPLNRADGGLSPHGMQHHRQQRPERANLHAQTRSHRQIVVTRDAKLAAQSKSEPPLPRWAPPDCSDLSPGAQAIMAGLAMAGQN